jgi:hypothetical protein
MVEARVMNQLQKWKKSGQTTEQSENTLKTPQAGGMITLTILGTSFGHVGAERITISRQESGHNFRLAGSS